MNEEIRDMLTATARRIAMSAGPLFPSDAATLRARWTQVSAAGLSDALRPEAEGGAGLVPRDLRDVLRLCGRADMGGPLADTIMENWTPRQTPAVDRDRAVVAVVRAVQMAGAIERLVELSVDHVNTRRQFGRPIGAFQAVQQMAARLAALSTSADAASDHALDMLSLQTNSWPVAAMAAFVETSRCSSEGAAIAHQLHGAGGLTLEHEVQELSRRIWSWRDDAGGAVACAIALGDWLLAEDADLAWSRIVEA